MHNHPAMTGLASAGDAHTHTGSIIDVVAPHSHTALGTAGGTPFHTHLTATAGPTRPIPDHNHTNPATASGNPLHTHEEGVGAWDRIWEPGFAAAAYSCYG